MPLRFVSLSATMPAKGRSQYSSPQSSPQPTAHRVFIRHLEPDVVKWCIHDEPLLNEARKTSAMAYLGSVFPEQANRPAGEWGVEPWLAPVPVDMSGGNGVRYSEARQTAPCCTARSAALFAGEYLE